MKLKKKITDKLVDSYHLLRDENYAVTVKLLGNKRKTTVSTLRPTKHSIKWHSKIR